MTDTLLFLAGFILAMLPSRLFLYGHEHPSAPRRGPHAGRTRRSRRWWRSPQLLIELVRVTTAVLLLLRFTSPVFALDLPPPAAEFLAPTLLVIAIGVHLSWSSSDPKVIFPVGIVTRQEGDASAGPPPAQPPGRSCTPEEGRPALSGRVPSGAADPACSAPPRTMPLQEREAD